MLEYSSVGKTCFNPGGRQQMMDGALERGRAHLGKRRLRARREKGALVELADSSNWAISPGHEIYTDHWVVDAEVTVVPGEIDEYPFDLINLQSGERVPAKYIGFANPDLGWQLLDE
jgi:hypothetical protein